MSVRRIQAAVCAVLFLCLFSFNTQAQQPAEKPIPRVAAPAKQTPDSNAMIWRFVGPITGTRGSVVLGHPTDNNVFYHGASGGLWKTPDAGQTWIPVGDGQFGTSSVGAMEISLSNISQMFKILSLSLEVTIKSNNFDFFAIFKE